jgi:anaerobic ribonucleoside-triphosphate reductase
MELDEINTELAELNARLPNVVGSQTEVYSRIVGYYRPVHNWNAGQKASFEQRKLFVIKENVV